MRTLQHEAFHQFSHWAISPDLPVWVNEGVAQVFEEGVWTGRDFLIEQVAPRRIRQLKADLDADRLIDFESFVTMDHRTWARTMRDREKGATQYNQAWAMVHFLVYAAGPDGKPLYRPLFFRMLQLIHNGVEPRAAFEHCFGRNFVGFEKRFREYAKRLRTTTEARYSEQLEVLSDLLVEIHEDERQSFNDIEQYRQHLVQGGYRLTYTKGNLKWQSDPDIRTYFRDTAGREMTAQQFTFIANPRAPLPDLVLRPPGGLEYRARFYFGVDGRIEREIVIRQF